MRLQERKLEQLGVRVAVVTFDHSPLAKNYVKQTGLSWPLLLDEERKLYAAYGLERLDAWSIYGPASVWHYLQLIFRGRKIAKPGRDYRQAGGNVIVDPNGLIRFHHVSTSPHDRPAVEELLGVVKTGDSAKP